MNDKEQKTVEQEAITACNLHTKGGFSYVCHGCLLATVASLCGIVESQRNQIRVLELAQIAPKPSDISYESMFTKPPTKAERLADKPVMSHEAVLKECERE